MSTETGKLKEQLFPTLERIVRRLVESYQPPDCIVLFGSYAYGAPNVAPSPSTFPTGRVCRPDVRPTLDPVLDVK